MSAPTASFAGVAAELRTPRGRVTHLRRLLACLGGGIVLALMYGQQQGTAQDFYIAFKDAWFAPRIVVFLAIGVIVYLLISLWPLVRPYVQRPGTKALGAGIVIVIIAQTIFNWYDPLDASSTGDRRFSRLGDVLGDTNGLEPLTEPFFTWLGWTLLVVCAALVALAIAARSGLDNSAPVLLGRLRPVLGYAGAVVALASAVIAYIAHDDVLSFGGIDHSLGVFVEILGFLVLAGAALTAQLADAPVSDTRAFLTRVFRFRPGLPMLVVALVLGLLSFARAGWFGVGSSVNYSLSQSSTRFQGTGVSALATTYLSWLGWTLLAACFVVGAAAVWLRSAVAAWTGAVLALASVIITFFVLKSMTDTAARVAPDFGRPWQNMGAGGFLACIVFSLVGAAMAQVLSGIRATRPARSRRRAQARAASSDGILPFTKVANSVRNTSAGKAVLIVLVALALFYPPTLTQDWQTTLVVNIGPYVLLAIGLNVVVGWAGLLDLGYIAFYEIGSYVTAYLTGSLPVKPPHFLHVFSSPLWSIPFAVIVCLIAGVLLGAPTLRLRGDYLAIVTLGFGEIIQVLATNNPGGLTGGNQGPTLPHPKLDLGFKTIVWGQDNLSYWYLLLVMLVVVVVLFYRLENSRLGRAWAAIREDEVAAQATGVDTTKVKLLAFAIGASTSGLAGVFFASQVGYFDPTLFSLQASILIVAYVVFGGMGSLYGAMAGAAVLTWLPQFLKSQVPLEDRQMWVGALVLAMMIFRPAGLIPARRRKAELEGLDGTSSAEPRAVPASEGV